MAWWRDAGVDIAVAEEPRKWLAGAKSASPVAPDLIRGPASSPSGPQDEEEAQARIKSGPTSGVRLPTFSDLPAFLEWLATDTSILAAYPPRRRSLPAANGAGLMIVADVPELGDVEAGRLLAGEVGALLDNMLKAMQLTRDQVYLATMAPGRPPSGRISESEEATLAPVLRAHVALAAPNKLWLMGRAASRALLGMDEVEAAHRLHCVNQGTTTMDVIATVHPSVLLREAKSGGRDRPRRKATWEAMQLLMKGQGK